MTQVFNKEFLFVCGCARSGTTALAQFLNWNPSVFLGSERYIGILQREGKITPDLYEPERFFDVRPGDTHYNSLEAFPVYRDVRDRYPDARFVGDKLPRLCWFYNDVEKEFPDAKFICIVRNLADVAASFKRRALNPDDRWSRGVSVAVEDWNRALHTSLDFLSTGKLLIVRYEDILLKGLDIERIGNFLGLDYSDQAEKLRDKIKERAKKTSTRNDVLTAEDRLQIEQKGDFAAYCRLLELGQNTP